MRALSLIPPQSFSLPATILRYCSKNTKTPKACQKLIKTCKYFLKQNQIFAVKNVRRKENQWFSNEKYFFNSRIEEFFLEEINSKFLIFGELQLDGKNILNEEIPILFNKILYCRLNFLFIFDLKLIYDEFIILTKSQSIKQFSFKNVTVNDSKNGKIMPLETILKMIPNAELIDYETTSSNGDITPETPSKLMELPVFKDLVTFDLVGIPVSFNHKEFLEFVKKNHHAHIFLHPSTTEIHKGEIKDFYLSKFSINVTIR